MPRIDLIDLSHHNAVSSPAALGDLPIWHKVNEGRSVDSAVKARLTWITDRPRWGGYTVVLPEAPGRSTIRQQLQTYADVVGPHWGPGAGTQLDVESWHNGTEYRYGRPVTADEIDEAVAVHVELFGRPPIVYANRNEPGMADVFRVWRARHPTHPYWMPNYGRSGAAAAVQLRADVWQWSSTRPLPGVASGCANEVINPAALDVVCGLTTQPGTPPTIPTEEPPMDTRPDTAFIWKPAGYQNQFLVGAGPAVALSARSAALLASRGVELVADDTHQHQLDSVLHQAGLTRSALVPAR